MPYSPPTFLAHSRFAVFAAGAVLCISVTALVGWFFQALSLAGGRGSFIPMAPTTAVFFLLLCGALLGHLLLPHGKAARLATRVTALAIILLSVAIFIDYFVETVNWNVEGVIIRWMGSHAGVGRMSPITAAGFFLSGEAVFLIAAAPHCGSKTKGFASLLASSVAVLGTVLLMGYLYGSPFLYGGSVIPVALPTAVCFLILGAGMIAAGAKDSFPKRLFLGNSVRSLLMRTFLPVTVAIVFIHGFLTARLYASLPNPSLISSLMTLVSLTVVGLLIGSQSEAISRKIERAEKERALAERKASESEDLFRSLFENTIDAMFVGSPDGGIEAANPEACRIFEMTEEEIRRAGWEGLVEREKLKDALEERKRSGRFRGEFLCRRKDGAVFPVEASSSLFTDKSGRSRTTVVLRDISERERMRRELEEANEVLKMLSNTDPLTHLFNRRYLMESLERELKRAKRGNRPLTLVMFDLDHFKLVNDVYGHLAGDAVLVAVAEAAQANLRCYEIAARFGGEEFVLLLPDTDLEGGVVVAERLREAVAALAFESPMENLAVTVSVGVATYPASSVEGGDGLIMKADEALYRAKKMGRNRVEIMAAGR